MKYTIQFPDGHSCDRALDDIRKDLHEGLINLDCRIRKSDSEEWLPVSSLVGPFPDNKPPTRPLSLTIACYFTIVSKTLVYALSVYVLVEAMSSPFLRVKVSGIAWIVGICELVGCWVSSIAMLRRIEWGRGLYLLTLVGTATFAVLMGKSGPIMVVGLAIQTAILFVIFSKTATSYFTGIPLENDVVVEPPEHSNIPFATRKFRDYEIVSCQECGKNIRIGRGYTEMFTCPLCGESQLAGPTGDGEQAVPPNGP